MRWRGRRGSTNIEDRRGSGFGGGRRAGFPIGVRTGRMGVGGIGLFIVIIIVSLIFGIDPRMLLGGGGSPEYRPGPEVQTQGAPPNDEAAQFVSVVLADTEETWGEVFSREGQTYPEPTLVLYSGAVGSACGTADSAVGPFYCGGDQRLYIDLSFFRELRSKFDAPGDFAQAYVIAHEVGHHVQNVIGVLEQYAAAKQNMSSTDANALSVRVELQADCFAGVWAHDTRQKGLLEEGDIEEALNAASQVGDDTIQRRTRGYVVPDTFNHGTAEQRARWFRKGLETGDPDACDTFKAAQL